MVSDSRSVHQVNSWLSDRSSSNVDPATIEIILEVTSPAELQPSLLLHWQYSMKMLNVPVRIKQNRSSPTIPGSPIKAQLRKYRHSPFTENKNCSVLNTKFKKRSYTDSAKVKKSIFIQTSEINKPFCRILRHIVGRTPGKWSKLAT